MVAAHGFNVWSSSKGICKHPLTGESCDPVEAIGDCADKGGPKWITKEATRYTKLQYGHSHHPPTAQHLIRGEILAYNYLHIFLDALYTVQDEATIHKSSLGDINASKSFSSPFLL